MGVETARQHGRRCIFRGGTGVDDYVSSWRGILVKAEPLAQQALEPIARHRTAGRTHAHGQAQARVAEGIAAHDYEKVGIGRAPTRGVYGVVLVLVGQAPATRKTVRRGLASTRSPGGQTARRLRPFARRRLSTSRPPFVAIRARNPWVRLRCRLLGWKGRFIVGSVCGKPPFRCPQRLTRRPGKWARKDTQ